MARINPAELPRHLDIVLFESQRNRNEISRLGNDIVSKAQVVLARCRIPSNPGSVDCTETIPVRLGEDIGGFRLQAHDGYTRMGFLSYSCRMRGVPLELIEDSKLPDDDGGRIIYTAVKLQGTSKLAEGERMLRLRDLFVISEFGWAGPPFDVHYGEDSPGSSDEQPSVTELSSIQALIEAIHQAKYPGVPIPDLPILEELSQRRRTSKIVRL